MDQRKLLREWSRGRAGERGMGSWEKPQSGEVSGSGADGHEPASTLCRPGTDRAPKAGLVTSRPSKASIPWDELLERVQSEGSGQKAETEAPRTGDLFRIHTGSSNRVRVDSRAPNFPRGLRTRDYSR